MTELVLKGSEITSKDDLHDFFIRSLDLPDWYGRNLDALYDCLTEQTEDVCIELIEMDILETHLGRYALGLQKMLKDAASENSHIILKI